MNKCYYHYEQIFIRIITSFNICIANKDIIKLEESSTITQKNPRAEITHKKYQKQIDWRRNKVRELLIRGYSQYEISNILHISQPAISRGINFVRNQTSSAAKQDLAQLMSYEQQNGLHSVEELMKNLWLILY